MFGLTYMQQISETSTGAGLHIEPGIWARVPGTTDPSEPPSVVRMASIPHGTVVLAQGVSEIHPGGPQHIPDNNILRSSSAAPPANGDFNAVAQTFTELDLSIRPNFAPPLPGSPRDDAQPEQRPPGRASEFTPRHEMKSRTFLHVSTTHSIIKAGGGTANTAFLAASGNPPGGNARATEVEATFWIETIAGTGGHPDKHQLQYTQLVMLDFNGIHWPHVTVATLLKQ